MNLLRTLWRRIVAAWVGMDPAGPHKSPLDTGYETSGYNPIARRGQKL